VREAGPRRIGFRQNEANRNRTAASFGVTKPAAEGLQQDLAERSQTGKGGAPGFGRTKPSRGEGAPGFGRTKPRGRSFIDLAERSQVGGALLRPGRTKPRGKGGRTELAERSQGGGAASIWCLVGAGSETTLQSRPPDQNDQSDFGEAAARRSFFVRPRHGAPIAGGVPYPPFIKCSELSICSYSRWGYWPLSIPSGPI